MSDSVIKANKKYYRQTLLEECKYVQGKIKMENHINDDLEKSDSDSDSNNETESDTDNDEFNEKILKSILILIKGIIRLLSLSACLNSINIWIYYCMIKKNSTHYEIIIKKLFYLSLCI